MARKLFETIKAGAPTSPAPVPSPVAPEAGSIDVALPRIRSARALRGGLMEISANSVRDIDPSTILEDGPRDRLDVGSGIEELAESIREHGQQVPILVRPTDEPDRYRVVYGRRRLAAARHLGIPVKALVRSLDDAASVVAQGQENSLRLNPSFIEKAVFVGALRDAGYESGTIQDALGISRQALSLLTIVQQSIPLAAIEAIGPAHDIGRRKWTELADLARGSDVDLLQVLSACQDELRCQGTSEGRFEAFLKAASARPSPAAGKSKPHPLVAPDGSSLGRLKRTSGEVVLALAVRDRPDFGAWLEENAQDLVSAWLAQWLAEHEARQITSQPTGKERSRIPKRQ